MLLINVTAGGDLQVNFFDDEKEQLRLVVSEVDLQDGDWHDISLRFDGAADLFSVDVDGQWQREGSVTGDVAEMKYHGLHLGNLWGQPSFDGMLGGLSLRVGTAEETASVVADAVADPVWLDPGAWLAQAGADGATLQGPQDQAMAVLSAPFAAAPVDTVHIVDLSTPISNEEQWLGRMPEFYDSEAIGFSVELGGLDDIGGRAQRVIWNYAKYGVEIAETGIGLRVGVKDEGMKRFWVDDFDYDNAADHAVSVYLDAENDIACLWMDDQLVLEIRDQDIDFVGNGGWEWGWDLGGGRGDVFQGEITGCQIWDYAEAPDPLILA